VIQITYITKSASVQIELPNENCGPIGWIPDGATIRNPAPVYERCYEAVPSMSYKPPEKFVAPVPGAIKDKRRRKK
tara:strand:+ start:1391 stop:1618 length:228 start_codon:yes stop_codon:yes gene_type:complete